MRGSETSAATATSFEDLARADMETLERVLLGSVAPNPDILSGRTYDGYNHDWMGQLPGKKFKKVFMKIDGENYGVNHVVRQDKDGYSGRWIPRHSGGKPVERGFFKVMYARETAQTKFSAPYRHLTYFDYGVPLNPRLGVPVRAIRDFVGLPNEKDYSLLLGKAYLRMAPWLTVFASYFVLKTEGV
jgi:hypothetical protein